MSNEKLVRKVLRSLPKSTFEMMFESTESSKRKWIALQTSCEDKEEEDLVETMSLLANNFNKALKRFNKKPYSRGNNPEEGSDNKVSNFVAFISRDTQEDDVIPIVNDCPTDIMSDEEGDLTEEELMVNYQMLLEKGGNWKKQVTSSVRTFVAAGTRSNQDPKKKFNWRNDYVTFGGGEKGRIIGKRSLNVERLPRLDDVLLVEGLTPNLISISQLSDSGMKVVFSKEA
ncbi:hypothetical protein LIER_30180 [Lithospermum erythrorhizon]|uniref:Uncharacterized protein n=1 Tax=Lithospermum erythrorhizon TaxID=34254 RepID=A0AAV3RMS2_LITER